jgi:hypothetical protein
MKDVVIGFSTNQDEQSVKVFCLSLRRVYSRDQCDIVIITNHYEDYFADLGRHGVHFMSTANNWAPTTGKLAKVINRIILNGMRIATKIRLFRSLVPEIAAAYPPLLEIWHHPQIIRWFAYERFLTLNRAYRQIFLSDVKDVIFQAPLFDQPTDYVSLFDQDEIYGPCYWDTKWYREAWGEKALTKVIGKRPLCIGTILGPHREVLSIVQELCAFFANHPFGRIEQSVFNYMLQNDLIRTPYRIVENVNGPVATLANEIAHNATVTRNGYIRRVVDDSIIPAVHMYDRWPDAKTASAMPLNPDQSLSQTDQPG